MPIYTKPQIHLLTDLVNEANPGLNLAPVAVENTRLGIPYHRTPGPGEIGDTSVEIFPRDNSFFIGRVVVHYRRIRVERLFANKVVEFDRWREANMTVDDLAKWLNQRYNTTFVAEDFAGSSWSSSTSVRTVEIHSSSLCYKGTLSFRWVRGKRELDQILQTRDFKGRYWSLLHKNTPEDHRPLLTLTNYGRDFTDFKRNIDMISNNSVIGSNTNTNHLRVILNRYNQIANTSLTVDEPHTTVNGLAGLRMTRVSIPSNNVTEANSDDFSHALVISSEEDSWFGGRIILHYNEVLFQINRTTMLYGDNFEFILLDSGYDGDLTYFWQLEGNINRLGIDEDGRGRLDFTDRTMFKRLTVPSSAGIAENAVFKVVIREGSYTGRVVIESDPITMIDVTGEEVFEWVDDVEDESTTPPDEGEDVVQEPIEEDDDEFVIPQGVWKIDLTLIAGSGGGGGSQLRTVWDDNSGGKGGGGELITRTFNVVPEDVVTWVLGHPGANGIGGNDPTEGQNGGDTIVYINGVEVTKARGGRGGKPGSRFEPNRNNDGQDGGSVTGNDGGLGGQPNGEDGQSGEGGKLILGYRSW